MSEYRVKAKKLLSEFLKPKELEKYEDEIYRYAKNVSKERGIKFKDFYNLCVYEDAGRLSLDKSKGQSFSLPDWDSEIYDSYKQKENKTVDEMAVGVVVQRGDAKCRKCGGNECSFYTLQTRSADESQSVFYTCLKCGNRWRVG